VLLKWWFNNIWVHLSVFIWYSPLHIPILSHINSVHALRTHFFDVCLEHLRLGPASGLLPPDFPPAKPLYAPHLCPHTCHIPSPSQTPRFYHASNSPLRHLLVTYLIHLEERNTPGLLQPDRVLFYQMPCPTAQTICVTLRQLFHHAILTSVSIPVTLDTDVDRSDDLALCPAVITFGTAIGIKRRGGKLGATAAPPLICPLPAPRRSAHSGDT